MRNKIIIFSLLLIGSASCKHQIADTSTWQTMWYDINTITAGNKEYKIFFLSKEWIESQKKVALDSNFIKKNIKTIDINLINDSDQYGQITNYKMYILDTLKIEQHRNHIIILEQVDDVLLGERYSLKLIIVSKMSVLSSYTLADKTREGSHDVVISSVIVPGNKIISRIVENNCSDYEDKGSLHCKSKQSTRFFNYDPQLGQYVSWKKSIQIIEDN
jgi:hypothetical protein